MHILLSCECEFLHLSTPFLGEIVVLLLYIHPAPCNLLVHMPMRQNTSLVGKQNRTKQLNQPKQANKKSSQYKEWESSLNAQSCPLILIGTQLTLQKHASPHCILCHAWQHSTDVLDVLIHCSLFKLLSHTPGACHHNHSIGFFSVLCFDYSVAKIPGSVWLICSHWHLDNLMWNGIPT